MNIKRFKNFCSENLAYDNYQNKKQLLYDINGYGPYNIYKNNWNIYNDKDQKIGKYYMFIDERKTLIIDKLNFDDIIDSSKDNIKEHAKDFINQIVNFCKENKIIAAVSPDRINDRKIRKKVKDFYLEKGFVSNKGKNTKTTINETMYKPL